MSLKICTNCRLPMNSARPTCHHCGARREVAAGKRNAMVTALVAALAAFALVPRRPAV